jgi:uncharacterized membrane protein YcaP (DUF421 family)
MLILFLRAVLLYIFILFILRMTGKRQIADLQPFDLIITMAIADLASTAIADTDIPLLYSVVPILGLYLVQQAVAFLSLRSRKFRTFVCGSPLLLVREGVLQEGIMKEANYTVADLSDHLRSQEVFDMRSVQYAILETNGALSVLQKQKADQPQPRLSYMLILDGAWCRAALRHLRIQPKALRALLKRFGVARIEDVFFLQHMGDGSLRLQLKAKVGAKVLDIPKKEAKELCS